MFYFSESFHEFAIDKLNLSGKLSVYKYSLSVNVSNHEIIKMMKGNTTRSLKSLIADHSRHCLQH